ncbi:MAG TPA: hypothetical protein VFS35_04675 [Terrimicrobiaceae bacterium]|nr:hypothetical protein [Terrimicrobiaceae bacterium]
MSLRYLRFAICLVNLAGVCFSAAADWKVHPASEFDEEVRVWASEKESDLDFSWSGGVNADHEAEGYGVLQWFKRGETGPQTNSIYTGEMKSGRRHGVGTALHRSGSKYVGEWRQNVKEGQGEYWYANGDYYAGSFGNDRMHGPGRYVSADGIIFEGTFANDERAGRGVVIYPDGRRHSSTWSAGRDLNPRGAPAAAPYLMLGVDARRYALGGKVFSEGENRTEMDDAHCLSYRGRFTGGDLVIDPNWPYWTAWSSGGPVIATDSVASDFDVGVFPVFLEIRVFNPGPERLVIRKAEVLVEESIPDLEPILRFQDASADKGGLTCRIVNFGPGPVESCEIAFNILPRNAKPKFESYAFVERLPAFSDRATFSLERAINALGIDATAIAAVEHVADDDPSRESVALRAMESLRRFPEFVKSDGHLFSAYALISGEVRLRWTDYYGASQTKNVKFVLTKCLGFFWAEYGALGAPTGSYDILLRTEGDGYVVPFSYKRTIASGGTDRFTLQIASEVSTYQSFRIRLTTADGRELVSPNCRMHFLVPRNHSWKTGYVIENP